MLRRTVVSLGLALLAMVAAAPAGAASAEATRACADAVRAMINANAEMSASSAFGTRSSAAIEEIPWRSVGGHEGVCRIDGQGRLYEIAIRSFPAGGGSFAPYYLTCSSEDGRRRECSIQAPSRVTLARRESRAECVEGSSWGAYGTTLWVDRGCRGVFQVSPLGSVGGGASPNETRARAACADRARREGLRVLRILGTWDRGGYVDVGMEIQRQGILATLDCRFDVRSGTTYWLNR